MAHEQNGSLAQLIDRSLTEVSGVATALRTAATMGDVLEQGRRLRATGAWLAAAAGRAEFPYRYPGVASVRRVSQVLHVVLTTEGAELVWPSNPTHDDILRRNRVMLGMRPGDRSRSALPALLSVLGVSPTPTAAIEVDRSIRDLTDLLEDLGLPVQGEVRIEPGN